MEERQREEIDARKIERGGVRKLNTYNDEPKI